MPGLLPGYSMTRIPVLPTVAFEYCGVLVNRSDHQCAASTVPSAGEVVTVLIADDPSVEFSGDVPRI